MNKLTVIILTLLFFLSCKAQNERVPSKIKMNDTEYITAEHNLFPNFDKKDYWEANNMNMMKSKYHIQNGLLYNRKKLVDSLEITYKKNDSVSYILWVNKGLPLKCIINVEGHPRPSYYEIEYDISGNLKNYKFPENKNYTKDGTGYLHLYYYGKQKIENYSNLYVNGEIQAEGAIQNNYKIGEWKYYNKLGKLDSMKVYSVEDSVDIRFPYCIFNKEEPCQ